MTQSLRHFSQKPLGAFFPVFIGGFLLVRPPVRKYCTSLNQKTNISHTRIFQFCTRHYCLPAINLGIDLMCFFEIIESKKFPFTTNLIVRTSSVTSIFRFPSLKNTYSIRQLFDFFFKRVFSKIGLFFRFFANFLISPISLGNLWGVNMFNFTHEGFARRFFPKFNHIFKVKISTAQRFISISRKG